MADEYGQNLPDIPERTATADTDLIHVNSGESDYKQSKQKFLRGNLAHQFANNSTLTSQLDTLASAIGFGTIHGDISSNGHQTETGMPVNSNGTVFARIFSTGQMSVSFFPNATSDEYVIFKQGTWGTWEKQPTRAEISALNNSLTNSFTMVELMRQLNVPTTDTSYSCDWASYRVLVIAHVFYGNVMSTIVESREHMMISNSGNRVIASTPSNDVQWSVWKNGDNAVWARASSANAQNGIAIFGLGKIS